MRIVFDTNVLISALIVAGGSADQVMQFVRKGEAELIRRLLSIRRLYRNFVKPCFRKKARVGLIRPVFIL